MSKPEAIGQELAEIRTARGDEPAHAREAEVRNPLSPERERLLRDVMAVIALAAVDWEISCRPDWTVPDSAGRIGNAPSTAGGALSENI
jgi:hypothetical protein